MGSSPIQVANASVAQSVEQGTENPRVVGSIPTGGTIYYADLAHLVECHLAKVEVASSSLVIRSIGRLIKAPFIFQKNQIRHHGQAVRQGPAKPLSPVRFWVVPPEKERQVERLVFSFSMKFAFGE